jgi:type II secretory pathway pseudopilin PulG
LVAIRRAHGFALIDLIFVCGMIGLLCSIAVPRLLLAKQAAGAASAIGSMRAINSAELTYALTCGFGFYAPDLTTLGTVPPGSDQPFISPDLGSANTVTKSGYIINLSGTAFPSAPGTCNGLAPGEAAEGFRSGADPADSTNTRFFGSNSNAIVWEDDATLYATMPEVGEPPTGHTLR